MTASVKARQELATITERTLADYQREGDSITVTIRLGQAWAAAAVDAAWTGTFADRDLHDAFTAAEAQLRQLWVEAADDDDPAMLERLEIIHEEIERVRLATYRKLRRAMIRAASDVVWQRPDDPRTPAAELHVR